MVIGDPQAIKMSWIDVPGDKLLEPKVSMVRARDLFTLFVYLFICLLTGRPPERQDSHETLRYA